MFLVIRRKRVRREGKRKRVNTWKLLIGIPRIRPRRCHTEVPTADVGSRPPHGQPQRTEITRFLIGIASGYSKRNARANQRKTRAAATYNLTLELDLRLSPWSTEVWERARRAQYASKQTRHATDASKHPQILHRTVSMPWGQ